MPHLTWTFYTFMNFSKYFVGNKPKGRISKWCFKKTKHVRFSEKRTFLLSDTHTYGLWQWEWFPHQRSPILFHKPTKKYDGQICTWVSNLYFIVQVPSSSRRYDRIMTENSKSSLSIKIFYQSSTEHLFFENNTKTKRHLWHFNWRKKTYFDYGSACKQNMALISVIRESFQPYTRTWKDGERWTYLKFWPWKWLMKKNNHTHQTFTYSKSAIETLKRRVKCV